MNNLKDITENFGALYYPKSALVFYESKKLETDFYVEYFDMDKNGSPINAHPLTVKEAQVLAKSLNIETDKNKTFLKPKGILPTNVLHINPNKKGTVLWYTKSQRKKLYFVDNLGIPNGEANIPALLWLATKTNLSLFALLSDRRPIQNTRLYYAPFFNGYKNGNICMGTVNIDIKNSSSVEEFIEAWENYFFNSYFSHLVSENPIKGNCVNLWKSLVDSEKPFPKDVLKHNLKTLKNLL